MQSIKYITALLLTLLSLSVQAELPNIYLGGWSKHLIPDKHNEIHNLLGVEYKGWVGGRFKNSFYDTTYFVAKKYNLVEYNHWELDVSVGASYGYKDCFHVDNDYPHQASDKLCPAVVPEIRYTKWRIQPTIMLVNGAVVGLFKIEF